jgi:hypothetical protein
MNANMGGLPPTMAARWGDLIDIQQSEVVLNQRRGARRSVPLVYTFESFDAEGELTELTFPLGPLDVLAELHICEGLSEDGARSVFPVLAAPGVVTVSMPGGWSFRLTSEEEK